MSELEFQPFDADNHYYEAIDAFTRHLDPKIAPRCVQWADIGGRKYHVVGGRGSRAGANATVDPLAKAGAVPDHLPGHPDFAAPYLSLADVEWACEELEWALARDARVVVLRPAPIWTATGPRSPGDVMFDPFWARVQEAGITVVAHAGDSGYSSQGYADDRFSATFEGGGRPSVRVMAMERAAYDFLITLVFDRVFERFPGVRVASVENGSERLP